MSYRFLWKQIASKAISSAMAKALLSMNTAELWERMARTESFSAEQVQRLREEVEARLREVQQQGEKERELVSRVVDELAREFLRRGGPR
jgi:predicted  nucleic acid-binding Zn-ribbon protein